MVGSKYVLLILRILGVDVHRVVFIFTNARDLLWTVSIILSVVPGKSYNISFWFRRVDVTHMESIVLMPFKDLISHEAID